MATDLSPAGASGSAFLEVNQRLSVLRRNGRLMIGQRVVRDDDGTFIPVHNEAFEDSDPFKTPPPSSPELRIQEIKERPQSNVSGYSALEKPTPAELPTRPVSTLLAADLMRIKADLTWSRVRLGKLNAKIDQAQATTLNGLAGGVDSEDIKRVGCIIVGRGVKSLPSSRSIEGKTYQDIMWDNLGYPDQTRRFWLKVMALMAVLAILCELKVNHTDNRYSIHRARPCWCSWILSLPQVSHRPQLQPKPWERHCPGFRCQRGYQYYPHGWGASCAA